MASKPFQIIVGALLLGTLATPVVILRLQRMQLESRVARQRQHTEFSRRLKEENKQLTDLVVKTGGGAAVGLVQSDLEHAQRELADLEQRARGKRKEAVKQAVADEDALANNRDPLRGLVRLEYFTESGQGTPTAAFQSLVAAVIKNQPERTAGLYALSPEARRKAEAIIAGLPDNARAQWTPEKLGELFLTGALSSAPALQIANVAMDGSERATLSFRIPGARGEPKLPMILGPLGWQAQVDERGIDVVRKHLDRADGKR
jgi:hypothetical protein